VRNLRCLVAEAPGGEGTPVQIVMDSMEDTRHEFDLAEETAVTATEARLGQLTTAGFTAAAPAGGPEGGSEFRRDA